MNNCDRHISADHSCAAVLCIIALIAVFPLLPALPGASAYAEETRSTVVAYDHQERPAQKRDKAVMPKITEKTEYYDISGMSEKDLRLQMCEKGCRWEDGNKYDSVTSWHIKWDYDRDQAPNTCSTRGFQPTIEIIYRYPKWDRPDGAPQELVQKWDAYFKNLVAHETGHRDIVVAASIELMREVQALPPAPTCKDLDRRVKELSRERIRKLRAEERQYDASTCHGVLQGAVFP